MSGNEARCNEHQRGDNNTSTYNRAKNDSAPTTDGMMALIRAMITRPVSKLKTPNVGDRKFEKRRKCPISWGSALFAAAESGKIFPGCNRRHCVQKAPVYPPPD